MENSPTIDQSYFTKIGLWPRGKKGILTAYISGFILSLILTIVSYALATQHKLSFVTLAVTILVLALIQFAVQAIFFLHLGTEMASRARLLVFGCAFVIVLIIVSGSLWIMLTLNARMMPSATQMNEYMNDQTGI